jgi:hypothetical protein
MGAEEPVLLVCSHPEAGQAWWMHVQGRFSDPAHRASGRIDFDKSTHRFDANAAHKASLRPVLMIDASGFAASGQTRAGAGPSDAVPTWDEVRTLIQRAWAMFSSDDSGLPDNAGGPGDASIGSDIGSVAAPVPVVDLLGEDIDITPARHLPSDSVARVSLDLLTRHRSSLQTLLAELPHLLPDLPPDRPPAGAAPRGSSLEELAQSGMLYIRRTAPRAVIEESSLPKIRRTIITGRDLVRAVPPTEEDDVLVPHVAPSVDRPGGAGPRRRRRFVLLGRPHQADSAVLDPWYLAGLLSSSDSGRQATRMAGTLRYEHALTFHVPLV